MKKTMLISILVTLLFIIASCGPKNLNAQPASCGDGKITPPEPCDIKNDDCPFGSFCSNNCSTCQPGTYCCTDQPGGEGARYWELRHNAIDCYKEPTLIADKCSDLNGEPTVTPIGFKSQPDAARNCVFGFACINNKLVKLCGKDYEKAVNTGIQTGTKQEISQWCPRPTTTSFNVNVNIERECEGGGYTLAYVSLDDPNQEIAKVDFMYKTPEQKSWTGMNNGLFYDKEYNKYYNSVKLNPGNYQYQISIKTTANELITAKEGTFNVGKC